MLALSVRGVGTHRRLAARGAQKAQRDAAGKPLRETPAPRGVISPLGSAGRGRRPPEGRGGGKGGKGGVGRPRTCVKARHGGFLLSALGAPPLSPYLQRSPSRRREEPCPGPVSDALPPPFPPRERAGRQHGAVLLAVSSRTGLGERLYQGPLAWRRCGHEAILVSARREAPLCVRRRRGAKGRPRAFLQLPLKSTVSVWWVEGVFLRVPPALCHLPHLAAYGWGGVGCKTSWLPEVKKVGKSHFKGEHGGSVGFCQL